MEKAKLADKLSSIAQIDFDAMLAYEEAIKRIDAVDNDIRESLQRFHDEHNRHVTELEKAISSMGLEPPAILRDLKGRVIEGMTALMSSTGTTGALKSMRQNEKLTNKTYQSAVSDPDFLSYPDDVRLILQKNYEDEKRHLLYIEAKLNVLSAVYK